MKTLRSYYNLTKPGIVMGNTISNIAGLALGSKGNLDVTIFAAAVIGLALVIASACVFNNILDRGIDSKMKRTKNRGLVTGEITVPHAVIYGTALLGAGVYLLGAYTTLMATYVALFGTFMYIVVYGYAKRRSPLGTIVGSISGAVPPVVGYTAFTGSLDAAAWILFFILVFWQMPHFYAIAMYRLKDYSAAKIPVLPSVKGMKETKFKSLLYILAFICTAPLLTIFDYTGAVYFAVSLLLGIIWLSVGLRGFNRESPETWAKRLFGFSLVVLTVLCIMISIERVFP